MVMAMLLASETGHEIVVLQVAMMPTRQVLQLVTIPI